MRYFKHLFALFILQLFFSCAWLDESENDKIVGSYSAYWADQESNREICKDVKDGSSFFSVVGNYVYSVGHTDRFIYAKTHFGNNPETDYYIIDTVQYTNRKKGVYGPLNKTEFDILVNRLKISNVNFDMNYNENP
jgi:hypothetical protein